MSSDSDTPLRTSRIKNPLELQRLRLEKLMKDPAKPVRIPSPPKSKQIKAPADYNNNIQGSSAGAGSGDFHVYRAHRRREYARIRMMEEETAREQEKKEFEEKRLKLEQELEAKTAKKRERRQKRRDNKRKAVSTSKDTTTATPNHASNDTATTSCNVSNDTTANAYTTTKSEEEHTV